MTNVNAAVSIRGGKVEARRVGGTAIAATAWTATPRYKTFGKPLVKDQKAAGTASYWKAGLSNR